VSTISGLPTRRSAKCFTELASPQRKLRTSSRNRLFHSFQLVQVGPGASCKRGGAQKKEIGA
jgi:hypothetical protein